MGVDLTVTSAVGVILDMEGFTAWQKAFDRDDEFYGEEYLYEAFRDWQREGIEFGTAGSYYTSNDDNKNYLYIERLTDQWDVYDIPGGIMEGPGQSKLTAAITDDEEDRIKFIAETMGTKDPVVVQFTAVLWY